LIVGVQDASGRVTMITTPLQAADGPERLRIPIGPALIATLIVVNIASVVLSLLS
jgi:hypothetical protein